MNIFVCLFAFLFLVKRSFGKKLTPLPLLDVQLESAFRTATTTITASYTLNPPSLRQLLFLNSPVCGAAVRTLGNLFVDFENYVEKLEKKLPGGGGAAGMVGGDGEGEGVDELLLGVLDQGTLERLVVVCEESLGWALWLAGGGKKEEEGGKEEEEEKEDEGKEKEEEVRERPGGMKRGGMRKASLGGVTFADQMEKFESTFSSSSSSSSSSSFSSSSSSASTPASPSLTSTTTSPQKSLLSGLFYPASSTATLATATTYAPPTHPTLGISFNEAFAALSLVIEAISTRPALSPLLKLLWGTKLNSLYSCVRDFVSVLFCFFNNDDTHCSVPMSMAVGCLHVCSTSLLLTHQQCQQGVTIIDMHLPRFLYTPKFAKVSFKNRNLL